MVNPVNMQLAHWNLEHAAQQLRDPAAAAAQAGLQGESAAAAVHRDGSVQPAGQGAEGERIGVRKKKDRQHQEGRKKKSGSPGLNTEEKPADGDSPEAGGLDFYA